MNRQFLCDGNHTDTDRLLRKEITKGLRFDDRFNDGLKANPNITLKCFDPIPVEQYLLYIEARLQRRRFVADYVHRDSNEPRDKANECVWKDLQLKDRVHKKLLQMSAYYRFCDACMGSVHELPLEKQSSSHPKL